MWFIWESSWKDHPLGTTNENSRNSNSISSKGGLHSIESCIAVETRIANLARRVEVLETKKPSPVNQISPNQFPTLGCTYCQAMIMCLRSVQYSKLSNNFLNRWMRPFQGRTMILMLQRTILAEESPKFLIELTQQWSPTVKPCKPLPSFQ